MNLDLELIENLVIDEITGQISKEDRETLQEAIDKYPEALKLRDELHRRLMTPLNAFKEKYSTEQEAEQILNVIQNQRRSRARVRRIAIAVAACVIIVVGLTYLVNVGKDKVNSSRIFSQFESSDKGIILFLPNGEHITLDSSAKQLKANNVSISTTDRTLSYHVADNNIGQFALLTVPNGMDYKIKLEDGSEIHINSASQLRFPLQFSKERREVCINGEAYIRVKSKANQPFIVHLPHGELEVLGTEFNVNTYDSGIHKIALVNGSVKVKAYNDSAVLKPGKEATSTENGLKTSTFDASEVLAWIQGRYYLNDASFYEISKLLSRWYGVTVVVDNDRAAKQQFTGYVFKTKPIEFTLDGMMLTNTIDYYTDAKGMIHIK
ncbi:FecR domain-containing protein [Chitinophaga filiformis]|uniref:FecR family protein n=1 Tax=Chitinophaga filiformis TaxID=104663 RepID=UPI001F3E701B|nr:FecR domain-containing protein [Chitinophaga filiformis]MCF6407519.1 FecR domain-containing protein [Chitinophaga filiformis]